MINEDLVSIIMSVYNEKKDNLEKSINSIIKQTYKNIEFIIIIDDPNNKEMCNFIENIAKKCKIIKLFYNDKNIGLTASLNKAIKLCNGNYIARMDSDDISEFTRIEKQLKYLKDNNLDLVGSEVRKIDENDEIIIQKTNKSYSSKCIEKCLKYDNVVAHPSWLLKKEVYIQLDGYRNMPSCEDYDFLIRAVNKKYRIGICDEILLNYRVNLKGISKSNPLKQKLASDYISKRFNKIYSVSVEEVNKYVNKKCTEKAQEKYKKAIRYFDEACRQHNNLFLFIIFILKAFFNSKYIINNFYRIINLRIIRLIYK